MYGILYRYIELVTRERHQRKVQLCEPMWSGGGTSLHVKYQIGFEKKETNQHLQCPLQLVATL